jgi:putative phage-type endonuclease
MNAREQWLVDRNSGIGGSDAAAALGQSQHKTPLQLFQEKTGLLDAQITGLDAIERVEFGHLLEEPIATVFARRYDVKLRRRNRIVRHRKHRFMVASFDRTIDGVREGLEIKTVSDMAYRFGGWGEEHSDVIPAEYLLQCHHYLTVSGYERWHVAALVGGNSLKVYCVDRDEEMSAMLIEGEHDFWQHIERNEAPALDYTHPTAIGLLRKMYPGTDGTTVHLSAEAETMHYARLDFDEQEKLMKAGSDAAKARIMHLMGSASIGLLPNGGAYRRKIIERKGYEVAPTKCLDFRYTKKGEPQ